MEPGRQTVGIVTTGGEATGKHSQGWLVHVAAGNLIFGGAEARSIPLRSNVAYDIVCSRAFELLFGTHARSYLQPPTGFAVGDWSIADGAFPPFYPRTLSMLEVNPATQVVRSAAEVSATLSGSPRFARIRKYLEDSMARPSAVKTWDPVRSDFASRFVKTRDC